MLSKLGNLQNPSILSRKELERRYALHIIIGISPRCQTRAFPQSGHAMCELVAMGESLTGHTPTAEKCADLSTKIIPGGQKRDHFVGKLLFDIVD